MGVVFFFGWIVGRTGYRSPVDSSSEIGKRYALVIGNAEYRVVPALTNPVNDSRDICSALKTLRFDVDCRENLRTRRAFRDAITNFVKKVKPEDVALFYFAGHGIEMNGENFLIPTDADIKTPAYVEDDAVRVNFVFDELATARARLSIVMLDACRNNPFAKVRSVSGTGLAIPTTMPAGSIIIFPTSPGRVAIDGLGRNGVFTTHLLKQIQEPGITIEEMFKRVISGVRDDAKAMGGEQIPWMNLSFTGEFCFVGCGTKIKASDYAAVLKEKEKIEQTTKSLQSDLASREADLQQFKVRMAVLQKQLDEQKHSSNLTLSEVDKLNKEREELVGKTLQLQSREQELQRVKTELGRLEAQQQEFTKREREMASARERITHLERQITLQEERKITVDNVESLKREQDELVRRNADLQKLQAETDTARKELAELRQRLVEYDRQKAELDGYKQKLAQLEIENRQKDESVRQMRKELEERQSELQSSRPAWWPCKASWKPARATSAWPRKTGHARKRSVRNWPARPSNWRPANRSCVTCVPPWRGRNNKVMTARRSRN